MGDEKKVTYPDEFSIVDGTRERRTMEDGVIVSFELPTIYADGDIDADKTTKYRKSIADAASVVAGLCPTIKTTPWRLIACAMRKSVSYGEYAALLDTFDDSMLSYDFDTAKETLQKLKDAAGTIPSYVSCSTKYDLEVMLNDEDDDDITEEKHDVKPLKMDDDTDEFYEAVSDVANLIDTIVNDYKSDGVMTDEGYDSKIGFVETIVMDIMGDYPVKTSADEDNDDKSGIKTLREVLKPAYDRTIEADTTYVEAEGNDGDEKQAEIELQKALREYADVLKEYGMENSPDYDSIMTELNLISVIDR